MRQTVKFDFEEGKARLTESVKTWYDENLIQGEIYDLKDKIDDIDILSMAKELEDYSESIALLQRERGNMVLAIMVAESLSELCKAVEGTPFGDDMYTFLYLLTEADYEEL